MQNLLFLFKTWLTQGSENQSFIGARWVAFMLCHAPKVWRRPLALRLLAWSPHYFYRDINQEYQALSHSEFLESEFKRNQATRERIRDEILKPVLNVQQLVLDYGCGPGFLASSVAAKVNKVIAVDISKGVLECARIINSKENLRYLHTLEINQLPSNSIDLVYSFAVIQHVTDDVFSEILLNAFELLKPGSKLLIHIVLDADGWRDQKSWEADKSLTGRIKLSYGLNCFSRNAEAVTTQVSNAGFISISIQPISKLCTEHFDDICEQHLLTAVKP